MAASTEIEPVRITKIAGRYLVFDVEDVSSLRRNHNICAVFVGTTPQNPTQNIFQGLPIELYPEEAKLLVEKGAGYIVDDTASHLARLTSHDAGSRAAYIQSLKTRRRNAQRAIDEEQAARKEIGLKARAKKNSKKAAEASNEAEDSLFSTEVAEPSEKKPQEDVERAVVKQHVHLTPTASSDLVDPTAQSTALIDTPHSYPLYAHLNSLGYYITPGLRFGGDYSVYPGDPFRYHAHFIATSFEWEEEITMLDIVGGGRLGTAVKKGFLIGGQASKEDDSQGDSSNNRPVRAFCLEWAGM